MRCIFCKSDSSTSKSREHIIPESLGNVNSFLPPGLVCDKCNNYFSREVEKPLLDSHYFRDLRFQMSVPSKKNKIPSIKGMHVQSMTQVELSKESGCSDIGIDIIESKNAAHARQVIRNSQRGTFVLPMPPMPEGHLIARFLAKVGLEALASKIFPMGDINELIDMKQLDDLRSYARRGSLGEVILITESEEYYIVVAIFGVEFALNLGSRCIENYYEWLRKHNAKSPLYVPKGSSC